MTKFCKEERLCSKKGISHLFTNGITFLNHPFTIKWIETASPQLYPVQLLAVVPKRNFKKAVDRNKIKRLIKEAYRNQKESLFTALNNKNKNLALMLIFSGKKMTTYKETEIKINVILQQLVQSV
ncbi:MAG: ribonuclease P protein component [Bacteroidota bacterium]